MTVHQEFSIKPDSSIVCTPKDIIKLTYIHCVCRLPKLEGIKMSVVIMEHGIMLTYVCQYLQIPNNHIQSGPCAKCKSWTEN